MISRKYGRGFSLIELMAVVAIIAIALAIAVPNLFKSTEKSQKIVCMSNLKNISSAMQLYAIENRIVSGTSLSGDQIETIYDTYLKRGEPKCPGGGEYTLHEVGADPQVTCSLADKGHELSQ